MPAKDVLLLTEGLSHPVLYCPTRHCFKYLTFDDQNLSKVKMELGKEEIFDKAWENAIRCG